MTTPTTSPGGVPAAEKAHIAIDIGGTKIASAYVTGDFTTLAGRAKRPTPKQDVLFEVIAAIKEAIAAATADGYEAVSVGIGAPGVIDTTTGTVVSAGPTMPGWQGTVIAPTVREACGLPVAVHNDVRLMALGEARFGAGNQYNRVLFVSLGTGVGGALVFDGALSASPHATAGELRNLRAADINGQVDVIENILAGPGIAATYNRLAETNLDLVAIMQHYHAGEALAQEIVQQSCFRGGQALGGFASAVDVDALIIGGGVGSIGDPVLEPLRAGVHEGALPPLAQLPVIPAQLGTEAPLFGAAWYGAQFGT